MIQDSLSGMFRVVSGGEGKERWWWEVKSDVVEIGSEWI